jgi:hypothetical protein
MTDSAPKILPTREETLISLTQLGEDPAADRVDAIFGRVRPFSAGSKPRESAVLDAVRTARNEFEGVPEFVFNDRGQGIFADHYLDRDGHPVGDTFVYILNAKLHGAEAKHASRDQLAEMVAGYSSAEMAEIMGVSATAGHKGGSTTERGNGGKAAPKYSPTKGQIRSAENLLLTMAHEATIRPVVEKYSTDILAAHQFRIAKKWAESGSEDEVILDRNSTFLLEPDDAAVFYVESAAARIAANLKVSSPDNCPLSEAESLRIGAENSFLEAMGESESLSAFGQHHLLNLEQRAQALDLSLKLLAPFVHSGHEILQRATTSSELDM